LQAAKPSENMGIMQVLCLLVSSGVHVSIRLVLYMAAARGILAAESRPLSLSQRVLSWFLRLRGMLGIGSKQ
jgi:hypothetical protein